MPNVKTKDTPNVVLDKRLEPRSDIIIKVSHESAFEARERTILSLLDCRRFV